MWFLWFLPSVVLGQESVQLVQENEYSSSIEISEGDDKNLGDFRIEISDGLTGTNPELWSWDMGGVDLFRLPDVPFEDESNDFISDALIGPVWNSDIGHLGQDQTAILRKNGGGQDWISLGQKSRSQESVTILEGNSRGISWTLSSQPSADVTVTITGYENTDLSVSPNQLIFTDQNWNIAQEVTLTANQDSDATPDPVISLSFTNSGGDTKSKELTVTILDDEIPWEFAPRTVREGSNVSLIVELLPYLAPPSGDVTFTISGHQGTNVVPNSQVLTFSIHDWQEPQILTITTQLDLDNLDEEVTLTFTASGGGYDGLKYIAEITIYDRPPYEEYVPEGESILSKIYLIYVGSPRNPSIDITVTWSGFEGTDLTLGQAVHMVTSKQWSRCRTPDGLGYCTPTVQTEIIAAHDPDDVDDSVDLTIAVTDAPPGSPILGVKQRITVTIGDDDDPGLIVDPSALTIKEGDPVGGTFEVQLSEAPLGDFGNNDVTVSILARRQTPLRANKTRLTFTASDWNKPQQVKLTVQDDDFLNDYVSEVIFLEASGGGYDLERGRVSVTIIDDDEPKLEITPTTITLEEGGPRKILDVRLAAQTSGEVTVTISEFGDEALSHGPDNPFKFPRFEYRSLPVWVRAAEDSDTDNETEILILTASGGGYDGVTGQVTVEVNDNDLAGASLVLAPAEIFVEEGSSEKFDVSLSTELTGEVTVTIPNFTNSALSSYPATLTFNASNHNIPQPVTVSAAKDLNAENEEETLILTASGGGYNGVEGEVTVKVNDNDQASLVLGPAVSVEEGSSSDFTVSLSMPPTDEVTVTIPAFKNPDLSWSSEPLIFNASNYNSPQSVTVTAARDDNTRNETEILTLTANGGGYDEVKGDIEVTVLDEGAVSVTLLATPVRVKEGAAVTLTAELSRALATTTVTIPLIYEETGEAPATEGLDYTGPASITIPAEKIKASETISIVNDETAENNETFRVALGTLPSEVEPGSPRSHVITIEDDDDPPPVQATLSVAPNPVNEGDPVTVTATLAKPLDEKVTIPVICTSLVTTSDEDYTCPPSITINARAPSGHAMLTTHVDEDADMEQVSVALGTHRMIESGGSIILTILDPPLPPSPAEVHLSVSPREVTEGDPVTVTATLAKPLDETVAIPIECSPRETEDYLCPAEIPIRAGQRSGSVRIEIRDDEIAEHAETFTVAIGAALPQGLNVGDPSSQKVTILDNDAAGIVFSQHPPLPVVEGADADYTVSLSSEPRSSVTLALTEGTERITWTPPVLTFTSSDWNSPQGVTVMAPLDDDATEEDVILTHFASSLDAFYDGLREYLPVTVLDTGVENLVIHPPKLPVPEGADDAFTVALSTKPLSSVTVVMSAFTNPELTRDPEELIFTPSTWATPQRVRVLAETDDDAEQDPVETLTLTALGGGYTGIFGKVQVTIEETDLKGIQLNPASLEITEGGPVGTYTVELTSAPTSEVEVTLRGDAAKATLTPMSLRFHSSNWKVPQTVRVEAVQDRDLDDETLTVFHTASGGGYDGERAELPLRITDQMPVTISIYDAQGQERAGRVDLRVELNRSTEIPITVGYETVAGTATSGEDYVRSRGLVIFDPGSRTGQIQIELIPDEIAEQEEQFTVRLANARPAGQVSIARPEGQVTIFDAARALAVRIDDAVMRGERVQFAVQLSAPSATSVRVHYRTEDQTARAGEDYHASIGVLTFAPGEWEQTIEVDLVPGRAPWQGKTFGMRLEHTTEGTIEKAMAVAMIQEESPSPEVEVMRAHAVRFVRTSTIQVVEGLRSRPTSSSCRAAERMGLVQLWGARSRWRPSLGELLAGCRVVQEQGVDRGWLSVWGQGAFTRFHGREEALNLRGEVTTAMLGTDYRWPSGWRTGLLVTHSLGEGSYRRLAESGQVQTSLTQVVPYVSVQWVDWEAWLALGYGRGQTEVAPLEGRLISVFGAAGVEGTWRSTRRAGWTLHGDVLVAEAEVNQYEVRGEVIRVRVGVQGVLRVHETIRPYVEANVRQDGGHAETGTGLELGGGVRFASGQVKAELRTQGLVMHTAEGFTEWGASGVVQVGGGSTGWGMTIRPSWGPTYGDRLHRQQTILNVTPAAANLYRTEVEFAYGAPMKFGVARSVMGVTQMPHGRMYRVGTQLRPWDRMRVSVFGLAHSRKQLGLNVRGALRY